MLAFWFEAVLKSVNGLGRPCCEARCTEASVQAIRSPVHGHPPMTVEGRVNPPSSPNPLQTGIGTAVSYWISDPLAGRCMLDRSLHEGPATAPRAVGQDSAGVRNCSVCICNLLAGMHPQVLSRTGAATGAYWYPDKRRQADGSTAALPLFSPSSCGMYGWSPEENARNGLPERPIV